MTTDLRLAVPTALTWLVAALAVAFEPRQALMAGAVLTAVSATAGILAWRLAPRDRPSLKGVRRGLAGGHRPSRNQWAGRNMWRGVVGGVVLTTAFCAAVLVSVGIQGIPRAALHLAADRGAVATIEGIVKSEAVAIAGPGPPRYRVTLAAVRLQVRGVVQSAAGPVTVIGKSEWCGLGYGSAVSAQGRIEAGDGDVILRTENGPEVLSGPSPAAVARIHAALADVAHDLSPQARGLVPGVAVGDTSSIDPELAATMRATSLTHITAVSGGHFAIVVSVVGALVAPIRRSVRAVAIATAMAAFVVLVHPQPSVLRAAGMGAVGVLALALGRPSRAIAALGSAVVVLVVIDPWLARSYGFVLSVLATAGLAVGSAPLARRLAPYCGRAVAMAVAVPVAAQAAVAPVVVLLDPVVTPYAVPANLLAAPALGPATVLGVSAALLAPLWPPGALILARIAGVFTGWIVLVARTFAGLPGARVPWLAGPVGAGALAAATLAVIAWLVLRRAPQREPLNLRAVLRAAGAPRVAMVGIAAVVILLVPMVVVPRILARVGAPPGDWVVAACDVGQGDALAIRSGPASAVLADVGPAPEALSHCLDELGIDRIDLLVISHYHADHVGGLAAALDRPIGAALIPGPGGQPPAGRAAVLAGLDDVGVAPVVADRGQSGTAGAASWTVLQTGDSDARPGPESGDESAANDASVVVRVDVAGISTVVLGDLEERGQERLARVVDGPVDVVKVAHHGSAAQSARLARVLDPRVALVSVGENSYGHPTRSALDLYGAGGAAVLRTDTCGTVTVLAREAELAIAGCG